MKTLRLGQLMGGCLHCLFCICLKTSAYFGNRCFPCIVPNFRRIGPWSGGIWTVPSQPLRRSINAHFKPVFLLYLVPNVSQRSFPILWQTVHVQVQLIQSLVQLLWVQSAVMLFPSKWFCDKWLRCEALFVILASSEHVPHRRCSTDTSP